MAQALIKGSSLYANPYEEAYTRAKFLRNFNQNTWEEAILRGDQDRYLKLLRDTDKVDLDASFYDPLQYSYENQMLQLEAQLADDTEIKDYSNLKDVDSYKEFIRQKAVADGVDLKRAGLDKDYAKQVNDKYKPMLEGQITDKMYLDYIIKQDRAAKEAEITYLRERAHKEAMSGWTKFGASSAATLGEIGEGTLRGLAAFFDVIPAVIYGTVMASADGVGGKNWFDAFAEYYDLGLMSMESNIGKALAEYERKYTSFRTIDGELTTSGKYLGQTANAIGYMLPSIALASVTGGASIGYGSLQIGVGNLAFYTQIFSQNIYENQTNMLTSGSPGELKFFNALTQAVSEAAIEYGLTKVLGLFGIGASTVDRLRGAGKVAGKAENIAKFVDKLGEVSTKKGMLNGLKYLGIDALHEGLEEFFQDMGDMAINYFTDMLMDGYGYNEYEKGIDIQTLTDSFITGALMSIAMTVGKGAIKRDASRIERTFFADQKDLRIKDRVSQFDTIVNEHRLGVLQSVAFNSIMEQFNESIKDLVETKIGEGDAKTIMSDAVTLNTAATEVGQFFAEISPERLANVKKFFDYIKKHPKLLKTDKAGLRKQIDKGIKDYRKMAEEARKTGDEKTAKYYEDRAKYYEKHANMIIRKRQSAQLQIFANEAQRAITTMLTVDSKIKFTKKAVENAITHTVEEVNRRVARGGDNSVAEASMSTVTGISDGENLTLLEREIDDKFVSKAKKKLAALHAEYDMIFLTDGNSTVENGSIAFVPVKWLDTYSESEIYQFLTEQKIIGDLLNNKRLTEASKPGEKSFFEQLVERDSALRGQSVNVEQALMDFLFNPSVYTDMLFGDKGVYFRENVAIITSIFGMIEEEAKKAKNKKAYKELIEQLRSTMRVPTMKAILAWPDIWLDPNLGLYKILSEQDRQYINMEIKRRAVLATGSPRNAFEVLTEDTFRDIDLRTDLETKAPKMYEQLQQFRKDPTKLSINEKRNIVAFINWYNWARTDLHKGVFLNIMTEIDRKISEVDKNTAEVKRFLTDEELKEIKNKAIKALSSMSSDTEKISLYVDLCYALQTAESSNERVLLTRNVQMLEREFGLEQYNYDRDISSTSLVVPAEAYYANNENNPDRIAIDEVFESFNKLFGNFDDLCAGIYNLASNMTLEELGKQMGEIGANSLTEFALVKINDMLYQRFKDQRYFVRAIRDESYLDSNSDSKQHFEFYTNFDKVLFGPSPDHQIAFLGMMTQLYASLKSENPSVIRSHVKTNIINAYRYISRYTYDSSEYASKLRLPISDIIGQTDSLADLSVQELIDGLGERLILFSKELAHHRPISGTRYRVLEGIPITKESLNPEFLQALSSIASHRNMSLRDVEDFNLCTERFFRDYCLQCVEGPGDSKAFGMLITSDISSALKGLSSDDFGDNDCLFLYDTDGNSLSYKDTIDIKRKILRGELRKESIALVDKEGKEVCYVTIGTPKNLVIFEAKCIGSNKYTSEELTYLIKSNRFKVSELEDPFTGAMFSATITDNLTGEVIAEEVLGQSIYSYYARPYYNNKALTIKDFYSEQVLQKFYNSGSIELVNNMSNIPLALMIGNFAGNYSFINNRIGMNINFRTDSILGTMTHELNHAYDENAYMNYRLHASKFYTSNRSRDRLVSTHKENDAYVVEAMNAISESIPSHTTDMYEALNYYKTQTEIFARAGKPDLPDFSWFENHGPDSVVSLEGAKSRAQWLAGANPDAVYTPYVANPELMRYESREYGTDESESPFTRYLEDTNSSVDGDITLANGKVAKVSMATSDTGIVTTNPSITAEGAAQLEQADALKVRTYMFKGQKEGVQVHLDLEALDKASTEYYQKLRAMSKEQRAEERSKVPVVTINGNNYDAYYILHFAKAFNNPQLKLFTPSKNAGGVILISEEGSDTIAFVRPVPATFEKAVNIYDNKNDTAQESEPKPAEPKPAEAKPTEAKPTEPKPAEAKPTEAKPTEPKLAEPKPTQETRQSTPEAKKWEALKTRLTGRNFTTAFTNAVKGTEVHSEKVGTFHDRATSDKVISAINRIVDPNLDAISKNSLTIDQIIKNPGKYLNEKIKKLLGDRIKNEGYVYSFLQGLISQTYPGVSLDVSLPGDITTAKYVFVDDKAFDDVFSSTIKKQLDNKIENDVAIRNLLLAKQKNGETVTLADIYDKYRLELLGIPSNIVIKINDNSEGTSYFEVTAENPKGIMHINFKDTMKHQITDTDLLMKINHEFRHVLQVYNKLSAGASGEFVVTDEILADIKNNVPEIFKDPEVRRIMTEKDDTNKDVDKKIAQAFVYLLTSGEINARGVQASFVGIKPVHVAKSGDGKIRAFMPWYDAENKKGAYELQFNYSESRKYDDYDDDENLDAMGFSRFEGDREQISDEDMDNLWTYMQEIVDAQTEEAFKDKEDVTEADRKKFQEKAYRKLQTKEEIDIVKMWRELQAKKAETQTEQTKEPTPVNEPVAEPQAATSIDTEYMQLAQDPKKNESKLKELVEEAAKTAFPESIRIQNGKFYPVWHHTNAAFTTFLPGLSPDPSGVKGIFFAPNEHGNISSSFGEGKPYYLNVKKVVVSGTKEGNSIVEELKKEQKDATNREEIAKINQDFSKRTGIDAIVDPLNGWFTVLSADLIRSADPIVYDDKGNIIPLSERFNIQAQIDHDIATVVEEQAKQDEEISAELDAMIDDVLRTELAALENDEARDQSRARLRALVEAGDPIRRGVNKIVSLSEDQFNAAHKYGIQLPWFTKERVETAKASRYVPKTGQSNYKKADGTLAEFQETNLKYFFKKGSKVQMTVPLRNFIVSTTGIDEEIDPVIMASIKDGKLTQQTLLSYFVSEKFGKTATEAQKQKTFELINEAFFANESFKSLEDLNKLTDSVEVAWGAAITLARYGFSMEALLEQNNLEKFLMVLNSEKLSDVRDAIMTQASFYDTFTDYEGKTRTTVPMTDSIKRKMKLIALRYFDGSMSSAYYIGSYGRRLLLEQGKLENANIDSLSRVIQGKDRDTETLESTLSEGRINKDADEAIDNLYDYYVARSAPIDSADDLSESEKLDRLCMIQLEAMIANLFKSNPGLSEEELKNYKKEIQDAVRKFRNAFMIGVGKKATINADAVNEAWSNTVMDNAIDNNRGVVVDVLTAAKNAKSLATLQRKAKRAATTILRYTVKERRLKFESLPPEIQAMFEKKGNKYVLKDEVYKVGRGREVGDRTDLTRESFAKDTDKVEENTKILTKYADELKDGRHVARATKDEIYRARGKRVKMLEKQNALLKKQMADMKAGRGAYSETTINLGDEKKRKKGEATRNNDTITVVSFQNKPVPQGLTSLLKTSFSQMVDTHIQHISRSIEGQIYERGAKGFKGDLQHERTSLNEFMDLNLGALQEWTTRDVLEIISFFKGGAMLLTDTPGAAGKFAAFEVFTLAYIVGNMDRNPNWALSEEEKAEARELFANRASLYGTGLRAIGEVQDIIDPYKHVFAQLKEYGIEAKDLVPLQLAIEKYNKAETQEAQRGIALEINREIGVIEGKMKQKKIRFRDKVQAYSYVAKLSSPLTWLRNIVTNVEMTGMNIVSDKIMSFVFSKLKKTYRVGQIDFAGTTATREVKDWSDKNIFNNPLLKRMYGGQTKYDPKYGVTGQAGYEVKFIDANGKTKTAHLDAFIRIIAEDLISDWRAAHKFVDDENGNKLLEMKDKAFQAASKFVMWAISDSKFIEFATKQYFNKLLQLRVDGKYPLFDKNNKFIGYANKLVLNENTLLTQSILQDFVESIRLASADYMHKPSLLADFQAWLKREYPNWAYAWSLFAPFVNSSLNFYTEALKLTPVGLAGAITRYARLEEEIAKRQELRRLQKGKMLTDPRFVESQIRRDIGKGIIGTIGLVTALIFAGLGIVRVIEEDDKYKLQLGDNVTLDVSTFLGTSSFITGLAIVSNIQNSAGKKWYEVFEKSVVATYNALSDGFPLRDVFDRYSYASTFGDAVLTFSDNFFRGFVPQAVQFLTAATRYYDVKYSSGLKGKIQKFIDSWSSAGSTWMAGSDFIIDPYTGEKQSKWAIQVPVVGSILGYGLKKSLGLYWTRKSAGQELSESLGVKKNPLTGKLTINGESIQLDYTTVNEKYGQLNATSLNSITKGKHRVQMKDGTYKELSWSQLNDNQKANVLNRMYDRNADIARIYAWTADGHKYYTGKDYMATLKKAGVKNVYYGDKGFVE